MALQVSNALTQALLQFRMNNLSKEVCTERVSLVPVARKEISSFIKTYTVEAPGVPNENIVQNHLNIALLNVC